MRRRLLRWLVCPSCQGDLNLLISESKRLSLDAAARAVLEASPVSVESADEIEVDVEKGALACDECGVYYPIYNGVPRMLTYPTKVAEVFANENRKWIEENLNGHRLPAQTPPQGEADVLRNFSTEWQEYEWTGDSYWNTTPENMLRIKRYELGLARHTLRHKLVLEVGIGIGGTGDLLTRHEDCELVGLDLGYAVDQARRYFGENPLFHIVQASVFAPPFKSQTFDVVYSHGVLHHTYSTREAFNRIAPLTKPNGMLYVWLYSHEQEKATPLRRALMGVEHVARPVISRLPSALQTGLLLPTLPLYMLRQNVYERYKYGKKTAARYGWNEALHAARDRLTPPFAYRHSYEEVADWFRAAEYDDLEMLRDEKPPETVPESYRVNVGIRGFRKPALELRHQ